MGKPAVQDLQDTFKISYDTYIDSREEAEEVNNFYHNRQFTVDQLNTLEERGQPAETFNVIKLFGRLLLGYYSTVVNTAKVSPTQHNDILTASLLNDVLSFTMRDNNFETEGDKVKLDAILSGIMCVHIDIVDTDKKDLFGRAIRRIIVSHVPQAEIAIDPMSRLEDYSDADYLHRWKWVSKQTIKKLFKKKNKEIEALEAYQNHVNVDDTQFEKVFGNQFQGIYKRYDNYLLLHSITQDEDDRVWSTYWCADTILSQEEITFKDVKFPYRVHKINTSDITEYYGVFREVKESQKAINQAILKIQLMANTQKAFIETGGVEDIKEFTKQFNRVNSVIPVKKLSKIKIEEASREILDQYVIIDKAFDRIQRVLGVNDAFLGMAFASDSGRKVKLQQNSTTMSLRYLTLRIEQFYRLLSWDIVHLVKQYYTATQVLRITDETVGDRWAQLNQPLTMWTGQFDQNGQPIMDFVWEEVLDPASGKPMKDERGNLIIAPVPSQETEVAFTEVDLIIDSVIYNDEDEKNQLMLETILQGNIGQLLSQVNPAGFFQASALAVKTMKTKHSIDISGILSQTAEMIAGAGNTHPATDPNSEGGVSGKTPTKSAQLKLPQNTNEGY